MALIYLVQHAQKQPGPGDPDLTALGREQARRTAEWLSGLGIGAVHSSPLRRARLVAFLQELAATPDGAVVTHGGVTIDALRTLAGDEAVATLMHDGMPSCGITTLVDLRVLRVARTDHLSGDGGSAEPVR